MINDHLPLIGIVIEISLNIKALKRRKFINQGFTLCGSACYIGVAVRPLVFVESPRWVRWQGYECFIKYDKPI